MHDFGQFILSVAQTEFAVCAVSHFLRTASFGFTQVLGIDDHVFPREILLIASMPDLVSLVGYMDIRFMVNDSDYGLESDVKT